MNKSESHSPSTFVVRVGRFVRKLILFSPSIIALATSVVAVVVVFSGYQAIKYNAFPYPQWPRIAQMQFLRQGQPSGVVWVKDNDLRTLQRVRCVEAAAISASNEETLDSENGRFRVTRVSSSPELFQMLAVTPELGRIPSLAKGSSEALLGSTAWRRLFGNSPLIIGSSFRIGKELFTVAGVMPRRFKWLQGDVYTAEPSGASDTAKSLYLRLGATVPPEVCAQSVLRVVDEFVQRDDGQRLQSTLRLHSLFIGEPSLAIVVRHLLAIGAGSLFLFVIAAANVAVFAYNRAIRQLPLRALEVALGATKLRLLWSATRDLIFIVLATGLLAAIATVVVLKHPLWWLPPSSLPSEVVISANIWVITGLTCGTLLCGLIIMLTANARLFMTVQSLQQVLAQSRSTGSKGLQVVYVASLFLQALMSIILVSLTTGLLMHTESQLHVEEGFSTRGIVSEGITLPASEYPTWDSKLAALERLEEALVQHGAVTISNAALPLPALSVEVVPGNSPSAGTFEHAQMLTVDSTFFPIFKTHLVEGSLFTARENAGSSHVAVVSRTFARQFFGTQSPIGHSLYIPALRSGYQDVGRPADATAIVTVIGVIEDVRSPLVARSSLAALYVPLSLFVPKELWVHIHQAEGYPFDIERLPQLISTVLPGAVNDIPVVLQGYYESLLFGNELMLEKLFSIFSVAALCVSMIGCYTLTSHIIATRKREFAIRLALGSSKLLIMRLALLTSVASVIAAGISVAGLAVVSSRLVKSGSALAIHMDISNVLFSSMCTLLVAAAASAIPAVMSIRGDLLRLLREE